MYRCTECQEEYKEKPAYCNCGNDEFEEILAPSQQTPAQFFDGTDRSARKKLPLNSILSISFLIFCIILSIGIWFIKLPESQNSETKPDTETLQQKIPADVENFWKDTDKPSAPEQEKNHPTAPKPSTQQSQAKTTSKPAQKQTVSAPEQTSKSTAAKPAAPKSAQKPVQTVSKPVQKNTQASTSAQSKPKLPDSVLNIGKSNQQTARPAQSAASKPAPKPEPPKMSSSEFLQYKGEVRSALLAKLNVAAIKGTGDCAVEFSLESTGKLINRNFIYKSSNKSVNDEVYLMLMRLPYYKQPPKYYNGEKIKLKFYFNNGYYEITFI